MGSISRLLPFLVSEDSVAERVLCDRYFERLSDLAGLRLSATAVRHADGEDVANDAFHRFFEAARRQGFDKLKNRDDLWKILCSIATRIVVDEIRSELAQKRGGGQVRREADLARNDGEQAFRLDEVADLQPEPDMVVALADDVAAFLDRLGDDDLRMILELRSIGCSEKEIAKKTGLSLRSVQRRFSHVRELFAENEPCGKG